MMTRHEVTEEVKRTQGDSHVRARIRRLRREAAKKRLCREVIGATVVVTGPMHLAVVLEYDRDTMSAPTVVAKGAGFHALRFVDLARTHGVPVLERESLTHAHYKALKVGEEIPAAMYYLVAEALAYVYRMRSPADRS